MESSKRMAKVERGVTAALERYWEVAGSKEEMAPMLQFFPADEDGEGVVALIAGELTADAKYDLCAMAQKASRERRDYAVALISEGWATRQDTGERTEILFVNIDARDGRRCLSWPIIRHPDGRRTLGKRASYSSNHSGMLAVLLAPELKED